MYLVNHDTNTHGLTIDTYDNGIVTFRIHHQNRPVVERVVAVGHRMDMEAYVYDKPALRLFDVQQLQFLTPYSIQRMVEWEALNPEGLVEYDAILYNSMSLMGGILKLVDRFTPRIQQTIKLFVDETEALTWLALHITPSHDTQPK